MASFIRGMNQRGGVTSSIGKVSHHMAYHKEGLGALCLALDCMLAVHQAGLALGCALNGLNNIV